MGGCLTFEEIVKSGIFSQEAELKLLKELQIYLEKNRIVFGDVVLSNIMCKKTDENTYKLVIVDRLGARRFSFKFWLQQHCKIFAKIRIKRQYKKLMRNYKALKSSQI